MRRRSAALRRAHAGARAERPSPSAVQKPKRSVSRGRRPRRGAGRGRAGRDARAVVVDPRPGRDRVQVRARHHDAVARRARQFRDDVARRALLGDGVDADRTARPRGRVRRPTRHRRRPSGSGSRAPPSVPDARPRTPLASRSWITLAPAARSLARITPSPRTTRPRRRQGADLPAREEPSQYAVPAARVAARQPRTTGTARASVAARMRKTGVRTSPEADETQATEQLDERSTRLVGERERARARTTRPSPTSFSRQSDQVLARPDPLPACPPRGSNSCPRPIVASARSWVHRSPAVPFPSPRQRRRWREPHPLGGRGSRPRHSGRVAARPSAARAPLGARSPHRPFRPARPPPRPAAEADQAAADAEHADHPVQESHRARPSEAHQAHASEPGVGHHTLEHRQRVRPRPSRRTPSPLQASFRSSRCRRTFIVIDLRRLRHREAPPTQMPNATSANDRAPSSSTFHGVDAVARRMISADVGPPSPIITTSMTPGAPHLPRPWSAPPPAPSTIRARS